MALFSRSFQKCCCEIGRYFHTSNSLRDDAYKKFMFNMKGFNKYGLLHDDILTEDAVVKEAIRRLPEEEQMQRLHRSIRACQAELNQSLLPKDQWTKLEDNHYYLQPYINEVLKEIEEREEWEANH